MATTVERWLLFRYKYGELAALSKPFKAKRQAEKARLDFLSRKRMSVGLGPIRVADDRN